MSRGSEPVVNPFAGHHSTEGYSQNKYVRQSRAAGRVGKIKGDGYIGKTTMSMAIENTPEVRSYILEMLSEAEVASEEFLWIEFKGIEEGKVGQFVLELASEKKGDRSFVITIADGDSRREALGEDMAAFFGEDAS